jgi:hypothetical protein
MRIQSCWISTEKRLPGYSKYLLSFACSGCLSCGYVTIERTRVGIALSSFGRHFPENQSALYNVYWAVTADARHSISCEYCGRAIVLLTASAIGAGISFSHPSSQAVTKGNRTNVTEEGLTDFIERLISQESRR